MTDRRCSRRLFIGAGLLLASCAADEGPVLTPTQDMVVRKAQGWFDALHVLRARFVEVDPGGATREGTLVYASGGRLRLDYAPGDHAVVIADDGRITATDRATGAVTRMPSGATPLGLLLGGTVRLRGGRIAVTAADERPGVLQISLAPAANRAAGLLTIVFGVAADGSLALSQIQAVDDERRPTDFRFFDVTTGGDVPNTRFEAA